MTVAATEVGDSSHGGEIASQQLFAVVAKVVGASSRPCVVWFTNPISLQVVELLLATPGVESVVLASAESALRDSYPDRVGHYMPGGGDWCLPARVGSELVFVGHWSNFGSRAAWSAWRAGMRGIRVIRDFFPEQRYPLGQVLVQKTIVSALRRVAQKILRRIPKFLRVPRLVFQVEQFFFQRRLRQFEQAYTVYRSPDYHPGKILIVGASLGPGGAERQLTATLLGLYDYGGHRDIHFLHHWAMTKPNDFYLPQLVSKRIPHSQIRLFDVSDCRGLAEVGNLTEKLQVLGNLCMEILPYTKEFIERRPEIAHIWLDQMNVTAGFAALLTGVPKIILACRSLAPTNFAFNQPYMRPIYRYLAQFPHVTFLNNSEAGAIDYRRWLGIPTIPIKVVRNGFDFSELPPVTELSRLSADYRRNLGIPLRSRLIGGVMRIAEEKRPWLWLEVAERIASRIPGAHFLLVGEGPLRAQVEAKAHKILPGVVHFPGHEKHVVKALAAMDIFLLTSRVEGLPNVLIEAQATGVPAVTLDVGGAREAMNHSYSGWLMDSSEPEEIAARVIKLLSDDQWMAQARHLGPEFIRSQFGRERMIKETLNAYGFSGNLNEE